ncbi:MAG: tetratricopeptide repeat protein [Pseudomonas sp.]
MNKWIPALAALAVLTGCTTVPRGAIPVVEGGTSMSGQQNAAVNRPAVAKPQALPDDSGVVVMVPGAGGNSAPLLTFPGAAAPSDSDAGSSAPLTFETPPAPNGIPSRSSGLAADEQLDGPILALLTAAQQQQSGGDLNGAASNLERAQRIAPREPQVLYRLAEVRLAQGDAAQAEQFARRGLTYANGRPALQANLWSLIAKARELQGDSAGAAQARERARFNL